MSIISVQGTGIRFVDPELVSLSLLISQEGSSRQECIDSVAALQLDLIALLEERKAGSHVTEFSAQKVQSGSFDKWVNDEQRNVLTQYARSEISVTYGDFDILSTDLVRFGAEPKLQLSNSGFKLSQISEHEIEKQLRAEAVQDARARAEIYAEAAGLQITGVEQISEPGIDGVNPSPVLRSHSLAKAEFSADMARGTAAQSSFDVIPEALKFEQNIIVHYQAQP